MSAPTIVSVTPASGASGVFTGEPVVVLFDQEVDRDTIESNLIVGTKTLKLLRTGAQPIDFWEARSAAWMGDSNFRGMLEGEFSYMRINNDDTDPYTGADDVAGSGDLWRTKVTFTPTKVLEQDKAYEVLLGPAVSHRTIFDIDATQTGTGMLTTQGSYLGTVEDTYTLTVTVAGTRNTSRYRWSRTSDSYVSEETTASRAHLTLSKNEDINILIGFSRGTYEIGDTFIFKVRPYTYNGEESAWDFQTGLLEVTTPTEEAVSLDASTVISEGSLAGTGVSAFAISQITPEHGSANLSASTNQIVFIFNENIDASTITTDTVYAEGISVNNVWNYDWNNDTSPDYPAAGTIPLSFSVNANVLTVTLIYGDSGGDLPWNNEIRIYLTDDILGASGNSLDNYLYYFTTRYSPIYVDISAVYSKIGQFLTSGSYSEDAIYRLLLYYSLKSDQYAHETTFNDPTKWKIIRHDWILCHVLLDVLQNLKASTGSNTRKRLADLSITFTGSDADLNSSISDARKCAQQSDYLLSRSVITLVASTVKGEWAPDTVTFGRLPSPHMYSKWPALNSNIDQTISGPGTSIRRNYRRKGNWNRGG